MATQALGLGYQMAGYNPANTTVNYNSYYPDPWVQWNLAAYTQQAAVHQPTREEEERAAALRKKYDDAKARAKELLLEHLSPVQRESFEKTGLFIVETEKKNRYQLGYNPPRKLREDDKAVTVYCIHMGGEVPKEDELLGFKLMLEANEEEFLKTANATLIAA